jgi:FAD/FMN-containing dehydrogenase
MVCLRQLDEVIGAETDAAGRQVVRVQTGFRLKKLNMWLQARGLEVPFQAEIGEASVGSVAAGDTKESSLDGPGYFSAHVVAITYVDEKGATLSDRQDGAAFHEFKCSFGLPGITLNVSWRPVRRRSAGRTSRSRHSRLPPNCPLPCSPSTRNATPCWRSSTSIKTLWRLYIDILAKH